MRIILVFLLAGCSFSAPLPPRLKVSEALSGPSRDVFAKALSPKPFTFPADHGAHPRFRTEWWYLTGHLNHAGREWSYQFTLFRNALGNFQLKPDSYWRSSQFYMGHLALADLSRSSYRSFERFARGAAGLAGAEGNRIWLEDWELQRTAPQTWHLKAKTAEFALNLNLEAQKPVALQGDRGLSQKGRSPGNASYYYSLTRLKSGGTLQTRQGDFTVEGTSWMDREWSTSSLDQDTAGWDWFSIQLDSFEEVMLYQLRLKKGGVAPTSSGTLIAANGSTRRLTHSQFQIKPLRTWQSPHSKARYPSGWRVEVPEGVLIIEPKLPNQEFQGTIRYWEGSCRVSGSLQNKPVSGSAFVELTGYD